MDGNHDVLVKHSLKIAGNSMHNCILAIVFKVHLSVAHIVKVVRRVLVFGYSLVGMLKGPQWLWSR